MQKKMVNFTATILGILIGFCVIMTISAQTATHRTPLDFDGDGKTDIFVARVFIPDYALEINKIEIPR
jgi:hypothetical protein